MKTNDKILKLVKHGLKATNLTRLNETQIDSLYSRLVEQVTKQTTYKVKGVPAGNYTVSSDPKDPNAVNLVSANEGEITEKSVSKQQQKLMGLALSVKKGETPKSKVSKSVKDMAKKMSKSDLEDFASTKHKGLPEKKKKETKEGEDVKKLEESILKLVQKHTPPTLTKSELIKLISKK